MSTLNSFLLPDEAPESVKIISWNMNELAVTDSRVLFTEKQNGDYMIISVPLSKILAVAVNNPKMSHMNAHVKIMVGGEWIRIDTPNKVNYEIAAALNGAINSL